MKNNNMIKFTNIVKQVILENSRYEILKKKFTEPIKKDNKVIPGKLKPEQFDQIVLADPTTIRDGDKIKKAGKYTQWLLKQFNGLNRAAEQEAEFGTPEYKGQLNRLQELFFEDLYKTTEDLQKYERFKGQLPENMRDINKLNIGQLFDAVKDFSLEMATMSKAERKTASTHPGGEIIHDGNDWEVIKIEDKGALGKEAACFYGGQNKETRWCTSAPGLNYFDTYIKQGPLYVLIDKNGEEKGSISGLPLHRYQFHFPSNQFMDVNDRQIDLIAFLNENPELKELFKPEFAEGLSSVDKKQVTVDYPRDTTSKYLALYGFDDFFETLPKDITSFDFSQKSTDGYGGKGVSSNINLKLPKEISKFKNLEALHLDGVVSELPEEIGKLDNLKFLSVPNNKYLKSIPSSVAQLPNLMVINITGSPNVKIPEEIQNKEGLIISK
jgi:hypothetical protein